MPATRIPSSTPQIADVHLLRGRNAAPDSAPDLLIEVPHGATDTSDFDAYAAQLEGQHPEGLVDFFHVNTDVGAFDLAMRTAERLLETEPSRTIIIVRSRIPRTFIDCNRRIEADASAFKEGGVTPGVMPWVHSEADWTFLRDRYDAYMGTVRAASHALVPGGAVLILHTYGPRTVGVEVDDDIVSSLRRAYEPDVVETWPIRPELDVISRDTEGRSHAPKAVVQALRSGLSETGWEVADSHTYPLHPSTMAWDHVMARPGLALCLEVRRDLLAERFVPFAQMTIDFAKVERIAIPLANAIRTWGTGGVS